MQDPVTVPSAPMKRICMVCSFHLVEATDAWSFVEGITDSGKLHLVAGADTMFVFMITSPLLFVFWFRRQWLIASAVSDDGSLHSQQAEGSTQVSNVSEILNYSWFTPSGSATTLSSLGTAV